MKLYDPRVDGLDGPLGIDSERPVLSWRYAPGDDDAFFDRISVSVRAVDRAGREGDELWGTTVDVGDLSVRLPAGIVESQTRYCWTASLAGGDGRGSEALRSYFETGMRGAAGWRFGWIRRDDSRRMDALGNPDDITGVDLPRSWRTMYCLPPAQFRTEFTLTGRVARARLSVTAHGVYRAWVNGRRVGDHELAPGWTDYDTQLEYQVFDVTDSLRDGVNALGAIVADGWWSGYLGYDTRSQGRQYGDKVELLAQLHVEYDDGTDLWVGTDGTWQAGSGEIAVADLLMGEYHDGTLATPGWLEPGFDGGAWRPALATPGDFSSLRGQSAPPIRALAELRPVEIVHTQGRWIVDFGQNFVGRVRLDLPAAASSPVVELVHGEMLSGGRVYTENLRTAEQRDLVVLGDRARTFEPLFTLHGFRYVEIAGWPGTLTAEDITGVVIGSDLPVTGEISTGSTLVERLQSNILWGQRSNYVGVPTDCPQRDERLGWTADTQIFARTASFNADVSGFLGRWARDLAATQQADGRVADVAPLPPRTDNFRTAAPGWGDAAVIVPWVLYQEYGDRELLAEHYPMMRRWVDWVAQNNPGGNWTHEVGTNYGDWLSVDEHTPQSLVAAAYRIRSTDLLARAAAELGDEDEARRRRADAGRLREIFATTFLGPDGRLLGDTQSAYLFALAWDLLPSSGLETAAARLVQKLEERGCRLTSGFLGINLLAPVLTRIGRPDLAVAVLLQREYPSWGYSIDHGATTIWERWDGWTEEAGFQDIRMNSFNHYSLGSIGEWIYRRVGGIDQAEGSVAYERIVVDPVLDERLSPVTARYESVRGVIQVSWRLEDGRGYAVVEIPPTASAEVRLPGVRAEVGPGTHRFEFEITRVTESGGQLDLVP